MFFICLESSVSIWTCAPIAFLLVDVPSSFNMNQLFFDLQLLWKIFKGELYGETTMSRQPSRSKSKYETFLI